MEIIDVQLHLSNDHGPEQLVAMMSAVGVDGAILTQASGQGTDNSRLFQAAIDYPGTFAVVGMVDPVAEDLDETVSEWSRRRDVVGTRLVILQDEQAEGLKDGHYDRLLRTAQAHGLPVFIFALHLFHDLARLARDYPELRLIIDHLGLPQKPKFEIEPDPWAELSGLLSLAEYPNVFVKCSAAPALSLSQYPFPDILPNIHRVIDSFGLDRVMWGSDITRTRQLHTYCEAVAYLKYNEEFSNVEKAALMGGNLRTILSWPVSAIG